MLWTSDGDVCYWLRGSMSALETLKVILVAGYVEWGSWVASESMG